MQAELKRRQGDVVPLYYSVNSPLSFLQKSLSQLKGTNSEKVLKSGTSSTRLYIVMPRSLIFIEIYVTPSQNTFCTV